MNNQDRAAQVLRIFPLFVSKLFTQDEREDAISAIAAYGQERSRTGIKKMRDAVAAMWNTMQSLDELDEAADRLLAEQREKPTEEEKARYRNEQDVRLQDAMAEQGKK